MRTIAAIYVQTNGHYPSMRGVDAWDKQRDARKYNGPHSVVAHPPCARWCALARLVQAVYGHKVGDDGGMFEHALGQLRRWGGVLEHPHLSLAFSTFGIRRPPRQGGWVRSRRGEWVCHVAQSAYGHKATKHTWLLYAGRNSPIELNWAQVKGKQTVSTRLDKKLTRGVEVITTDEAMDSPIEFAELLVDMARNCGGPPGR